ncbi:hypothetical protein C922_02637 [Plasmodium inui San Antonio 1]|uniref:Thrombospondin-related protein 1 n=1 Tax=Plasmodium inui San Antonio 1 TaxID=1237626 RepID=W7A749_9APIC|nr:hypothetical protein C922_02637 [Plasmodium inui San Antonio 1]EUD67053.1 hypothetical protein C922_02637 [Plasmodium inui San Antonio 1]
MNKRQILFSAVLLSLLVAPLPPCERNVAGEVFSGEEECTVEVPHGGGSAPRSDANVNWAHSAWIGVTWGASAWKDATSANTIWRMRSTAMSSPAASPKSKWGTSSKGSRRTSRSLQEGDDAKKDSQGGENTSQYFKCFVDKAKENQGAKEDDMARWVDPKHNSCYCSEENTEPCSMDDVSNSKFVNQLMGKEICDLNDMGNKNNLNLFIVLDNYSTIKCSNIESRTEKINQMELYQYCKNGLPAWDNRHFYEYLNCDKVRNKKGKKRKEERKQNEVGPDETCVDLCKEIRDLCNSKNSQFYSFEMCSKYYEMNHFTANIFNRIFKKFHERCSYFDPTNKGLLLCKHKHIPCEFSEWSDWSDCSKSCKDDTYDVEAIRTRKRHLIKEVKYAGKACSIVVNDKNKLSDIQFCDEVPLCSSLHPPSNAPNDPNRAAEAPTSEKMYSPPFVIPLKEIEKANILYDLNQPDGDVIDENFVQNASDDRTECIVTDMGRFENSREYSEKVKSCACPVYHSPCYFKDVYKSNYWKESFDRHCADNPTLNVFTADFVMLSCDNSVTIRKKEIAINTYLAMTFDCRSPTFRYLFCSKSNESSSRTNIFYIIFTCALALISALYLIHLLISERDKWAFFIQGVIHSKSRSRSAGPSPGSSSDEDSEEDGGKAGDKDSDAGKATLPGETLTKGATGKADGNPMPDDNLKEDGNLKPDETITAESTPPPGDTPLNTSPSRRP